MENEATGAPNAPAVVIPATNTITEPVNAPTQPSAPQEAPAATAPADTAGGPSAPPDEAWLLRDDILQEPQKKEGEEEEDPLVVALREQEEREKALAEAADVGPSDDAFMRAFYSDMKEVDRENEVNRILGAFKLNPYEMLGLKFDATAEDVRRQYRKVSLAVHPDKCSHPQAKNAFEIIGHAQKELLDEDKRKRIDYILDAAREEIRKEWRKAARHDAATRLAAVLEEGGREAVHASREQTEEFQESWKLKARDYLAKAEWRRRKLGKRMKEEEERAKDEYKAEKEENKRKRDEDKAWEATRESRVGSWRDFVAGKGKKKAKKSSGGVKPPKSKTSDQDKSYVQRPVAR